MTLFTVQGKPVLVCICCFTLPIQSPGRGLGIGTLAHLGKGGEWKGEKSEGLWQSFGREVEIGEKSKVLTSPHPHPHSPIACSIPPTTGPVLKGPGNPFLTSSPGRYPRGDVTNPAGLALLLPFSPVCEGKNHPNAPKLGQARCPKASTLLANAGPCPPSPHG